LLVVRHLLLAFLIANALPAPLPQPSGPIVGAAALVPDDDPGDCGDLAGDVDGDADEDCLPTRICFVHPPAPSEPIALADPLLPESQPPSQLFRPPNRVPSRAQFNG
jgi:hypothetical protein